MQKINGDYYKLIDAILRTVRIAFREPLIL